jgi:hypothetical protein
MAHVYGCVAIGLWWTFFFSSLLSHFSLPNYQGVLPFIFLFNLVLIFLVAICLIFLSPFD